MATPYIGELLAEHRTRLVRLARALLGDRPAAEDAVQEVAHRLLVREEALRGARDPVAYVTRAVINECASRNRVRARRPEVPLAEAEGSVADDLRLRRLRIALLDALRQLPERQKHVLVLRYLEDMDDLAVAGVLGCSRVAVRLAAMRGLRRLRTEFPQLSQE